MNALWLIDNSKPTASINMKVPGDEGIAVDLIINIATQITSIFQQLQNSLLPVLLFVFFSITSDEVFWSVWDTMRFHS